MHQIKFRFYGELNDLLDESYRETEFTVRYRGRPTIKHLIESLGVPHPEVGEISVNGNVVNLSYTPVENQSVKVFPIDVGNQSKHRGYHQVDANRLPRFVLDNHLGKLAIYLRMLGIDSLYQNNFQDDELARIASNSDRILLTRDRNLLKRSTIKQGYIIRSVIPKKQVVEILNRYKLKEKIQPFKRCLICNGELIPVKKESILDRLQPLTIRYYQEFMKCDACDQIYWKGSHYLRMKKFLDGVTGNRTSYSKWNRYD